MVVTGSIPGQNYPLNFISFFSGGLGKSSLALLPLPFVVTCPSKPALSLSAAGLWCSCLWMPGEGKTVMGL